MLQWKYSGKIRKNRKDFDTLDLPEDQIPWSWAEFPCEASPQRAARGCWSLCWAEAGGAASLGPAGQTAKGACPSPTPLGPPILLSDRGPEMSQHTRIVKLYCNISHEKEVSCASDKESEAIWNQQAKDHFLVGLYGFKP